jgi:nicotinamide-nucleotide amidase
MTVGPRKTLEAVIVETLATDIPDHVQDRILRLLERASELRRPLATAESCTGGLLASVFTDVEGYSHAFERGYVVYAAASKTEMLGVSPDLLDRHGPVSREAAIAMAEGALERSDAHVALSVTGNAGPAGDDEEGLVHFACASRGRETAHREEHFGAIGRAGVRQECLRVAIDMFGEALE